MKAFLMCASVVLLPCSLSAEVSREHIEQIDATVREFAKKQTSGGVAVTIVYPHPYDDENYHYEMFSYGNTKGPLSSPPKSNTIFYLASITKVFTSTILAKFAKEGKVNLNDPAQKYVPEWVRVPSFNGKEITLRELATHTSGLSRELDPSTEPETDEYKTEHFYESLNHVKLPYAPGSMYLYSNMGFGFLGLILANVAGKSYEELVIDELCAPLGMYDTRIHYSPEQEARKPEFFNNEGALVSPAHCKTCLVLAGGGALASTLEDMSRFLAFNMELFDTEMNSFLPLVQKRYFPLSTNEFSCLGWDNVPLSKESPFMIYSKPGSMYGISTYIAYVKGAKIGVVVLANRNIDTEGLGRTLLKMLSTLF